MKRSNHSSAADRLLAARQHARTIDGLPSALQPSDIDDSYRLQQQLNVKLSAAGYGQIVGHKIGCTSDVMQSYLGIPHPCAGQMFAHSVKYQHGIFKAAELCRPGVECEIAVRLAADMLSDRAFTRNECEPYIEHTMASIELVDDRWTDFSKVSTTTLIAENFFNAGCVLGNPCSATAQQLKETRGTLSINGEVISSGTGADILGHPHQALAWLANHQQQLGQPLKAGTIVTLGSVVKTQWIKTGDLVEIEFTGLGKASLALD